ncbi:(d)CMP kinase [Candidatus Lokiarchaeum ossiferum]|uniref:(d)CMP kinase n=1 Tax=Candidatus Lokiarchaeum ossiferum TaxID=2951803 RepID=UPI00352E2DDF
MNFSFAGLHGTGKSTIAKKVADHLNYTFYSTGMAFRELAKEKDMSLEDFSLYAEDHFEIDKELDGKILKLAQTGENYVFEGQLPTYMLGELKDFAILLTCDEKVRIERMMDRDVRTFEAQRHETLVREESERQRFIDIYQIDVLDPATMHKTFDLIINTTHLGIKAIFNICITALTEFIHGQR